VLGLLAILIRPLLLPLWLAAILAFTIDRARTGQALLVAAVLNTLVAALQERKRERAAAALDEDLPAFGRVLRDGYEQMLPTARLVPGDILLLRPGDVLPADARVIEADQLHLVNPLHGRPDDVFHKSADAFVDEEQSGGELPNIVYAGSKIAGGHGRAVVFATGVRTEFGRIAVLTQQAHVEPSPLLLAFARLGTIVLLIGMIGAIGGYLYTTRVVGLGVERGLGVAILFLVAATPAGLMPGITIALVEGARRLQRRNAVFRRLSSVETLGATTVICADNTGTLTQNELTVREIWTAAGVLDVSGIGYRPHGAFHRDGALLEPDAARAEIGPLLEAAALTTTARLLPPNTLHPFWHIVGDPVEAALVAVAAKGGVEALKTRGRYRVLSLLNAAGPSALHGVVAADKQGAIALVRGALGEILPRCAMILDGATERPIDEADRRAAQQFARQAERETMRVIAFARRMLPAGEADNARSDAVARDLTLLGLMAVVDPPRADVAAAIEACHAARIRTIMLTGDDLLSAVSVARRCGMAHNGAPPVITGPELAQMDDAALRERLTQGNLVLARLTPDQKVRVVETLEALGEVVVVTGGMASDVPALKAASTGIALAESGNPAAIQAADVILLDDNVATISAMIAEGRAVEQRVRRLVMLNLAATVVKLAALVIALLTGLPLLLTVGQLLLIDLLGGMLPGLGVGAGRPDPQLMRRPPRPSGRPLLSAKVYVLGYGVFGGIAAALALLVTIIYARRERLEEGSVAVLDLFISGLQPYLARIATPEGVHTLTATSLYVMVGIAALLGFALVPRSLAPGDRLPRLVLAGLVTLSFALLGAIIVVEPIHPYIDLIRVPWWGWLAAAGATVITALLESLRQRLDPIVPPLESAPPPTLDARRA